MFRSRQFIQLHVIGLGLSGRNESPFVIFESPDSSELVPVELSPFDAETIIRDYIGEAEDSAVSFISELLGSRPPKDAILIPANEGGAMMVLFRFFGLRSNRKLPMGEGLALARRLSLSLHADSSILSGTRDELDWLTAAKVFSRDFLYLSPMQYASAIPVE